MFKPYRPKTKLAASIGVLIAGFCLLILPATVSASGLPVAGPATPPIPTPAPSPCDPEYYDSLKSRAWLEAQREITQNQNLIFKPDSVLEYTCFDLFAGELAEQALYMFSETTRWGRIEGLDDKSMDNALEKLVGVAMRQYINQNFNHKFLGGRNNADKRKLTSPIKGGRYTCDAMRSIWVGAKCWDSVSNGIHDGFYTFEQYTTSPDHRYLPTACAPIKDRWAENIGKAYTDTAQPPQGSMPALPGTPWTEDNVVTYLERLNPENCTAATGLLQKVFPIATGLIVENVKSGQKPYPEYICPPAGCYYDAKDKRCARP